MIRPLRRAHRFAWIALSIVLPAILIAGLMARRATTPPNAALQWELYE